MMDPSLVARMGLLAGATLVSEDLTCIAAGTLAARGEIGLLPAVIACFVGIVAGDLLLFLAGRLLGRRALALAPLRWLVPPERVGSASQWLARRGPGVVLLSRFLPGARLPVYFAAGLLETSFARFALWFAAAALLWTPLLVVASALLGATAILPLVERGGSGILAALLLVGLLAAGWKAAALSLSTRGRLLLHSSWIRIRRYEYWPTSIFYIPVALYILYLGVKHRCLTLFTAANPAMPAGGFVAESKSAILAALQDSGAPVARFRLLPADEAPEAKIARALAFIADQGLTYPVILKPDVGERGRGVALAASEAELESSLRTTQSDLLVQEYVPGPELGVFYVRPPGGERGFIFSITEKVLPSVTGDGHRTLEQLVLEEESIRGMLRLHLGRLQEPQRIPERGETVLLGAFGNHSRGALFLDGGRLETPALVEAVERMSRGYRGFHFGRYDLRAPSLQAFREGRDIRILELNGVTSEAGDIYDPANNVLAAWRKLFRQWRLAFAIGAENRRRGATPARLGDLLQLVASGRIAPAPPSSGASTLPA